MMSGFNIVKEYDIFEDDGAGNQKVYWKIKLPMMSERDNVMSIKVQRFEE